MLNTSSSGMSPASISRSTSRTVAICASGLGDDASTMCRISSDSTTTSSVERNASTSWCGSLRMKPDRVGNQDRLAAGQRQTARACVERGEQAVLGVHVGVGQRVEQRRLARVRVAGDRHVVQTRPLPLRALHAARLAERLEFAFERGDAALQTPAVDFELRFTGTTRTDESAVAALLRQRLAASLEPRQPVAQQREFDLRLAFERARVLGEDVEDHVGAIDGRAPEDLLEVALLRRRQFVVEHDRVGVDGLGQLVQLVGLALADVGRGIGRVAALQRRALLRRRRRCRPAARARRGTPRPSSGSLRPNTTPTRTIFSRKLRSISVMVVGSYGISMRADEAHRSSELHMLGIGDVDRRVAAGLANRHQWFR